MFLRGVKGNIDQKWVNAFRANVPIYFNAFQWSIETNINICSCIYNFIFI